MALNSQFERVENDESFLNDVERVAEEIAPLVSEAKVVRTNDTATTAHLDVVTLEGEKLSIELSSQGFKATNLPNSRSFETIYALMDNYSSKFREKFAQTISAKLDAVN